MDIAFVVLELNTGRASKSFSKSLRSFVFFKSPVLAGSDYFGERGLGFFCPSMDGGSDAPPAIAEPSRHNLKRSRFKDSNKNYDQENFCGPLNAFNGVRNLRHAGSREP